MTDTLIKLSGSTDGKGVKVAATGTPGTLIHTAHATALDIVTLKVVNNNAAGVSRTVTIEWGGTTDVDHTITTSIPPKGNGEIHTIDRLPLTNGLVIRAFCDVANEVVIYGLVVRSAP